MIDAVLFDLGDTIIDFGVGRREAEVLFRQRTPRLPTPLSGLNHRRTLPSFNRCTLKVHYRTMSRAYVWSKISRRDFSYQDILDPHASPVGPSTSPLRIFTSWLRSGISRSILTRPPSTPAFRPMLEQLRRSRHPLWALSQILSSRRIALDEHLAGKKGLLEYFPVRVYSSFVRYRKPHSRIFEIALSQIGTPASRTLFIGDLLAADIAGAKRAGMHTIWKPARKVQINGSYPTPPRRHLPDFIIPKVTHLPEALHHFGWQPPRTRHHTPV